MFQSDARGGPGPSLRDAEALLRSLVGIAAASVTAGPDGSLEKIDVVAEPGTGDRQLMRNVLSAIRARFGVALDPATISINPDRADNPLPGRPGSATSAPPAATAATLAPAPPVGRPSGPVSGHADTATTGMNGSAASNGEHPSGTSGNRVHSGAADPAARANGLVPAPDPGRHTNGHSGAGPNGYAASSNGAHAQHVYGSTGTNGSIASNGAHAPPVRLEATELHRLDRALRCRVVVALGNERFVGIADALEDRPSEIDLAARVTIDALRAARTPRDPVHFEGAAFATVAGRQHVVVALRVWSGADFDSVAGAEPVNGSAAEAAARAVIRTVNARL